MKFTIERNLQGRVMPGMPVSIEVGPIQGRTDYRCPANCMLVWPVLSASVPELIERKLVLQSQRDDRVFVCECLGRAVNDELFPDVLVDHLETWGRNCGASMAVYRGHIEKLLDAHAAYVRTGQSRVFHKPFEHSDDCALGLGGECDCYHFPELDRSICAMDTETTGIDPVLDRLVSIGVTVINPDGTRRRWETLINPEMPIPPVVTEIHGITDEMVKDVPKFRDIAQKLMSGLAGKDLLLYNGRRLDLPIIDESLRRCGMKLNLAGVRVIDAAGLFFKLNPRDLSAFVERYARRSHEGAHGAAADAEGTLDGYLGLLAEHQDIRMMTLDQQATYSMYGDDPDRLPCDLAGKLYLKGGEVYFGFGKAKDKRVAEDSGYAYWILKCSDPPFPGSTCDALRAELDRLGL